MMFFTEAFREAWDSFNSLYEDFQQSDFQLLQELENTPIKIQYNQAKYKLFNELIKNNTYKYLLSDNTTINQSLVPNYDLAAIIAELKKTQKQDVEEIKHYISSKSQLPEKLKDLANKVGTFFPDNPDFSKSGIYALYLPSTGQIYIGQAFRKTGFRGRFWEHATANNTGKQNDSSFHALAKYLVAPGSGLREFKCLVIFQVEDSYTNISEEYKKLYHILIDHLEYYYAQFFCENMAHFNTKTGGQFKYNTATADSDADDAVLRSYAELLRFCFIETESHDYYTSNKQIYSKFWLSKNQFNAVNNCVINKNKLVIKQLQKIIDNSIDYFSLDEKNRIAELFNAWQTAEQPKSLLAFCGFPETEYSAKNTPIVKPRVILVGMPFKSSAENIETFLSCTREQLYALPAEFIKLQSNGQDGHSYTIIGTDETRSANNKYLKLNEQDCQKILNSDWDILKTIGLNKDKLAELNIESPKDLFRLDYSELHKLSSPGAKIFFKYNEQYYWLKKFS